MSFDFEILVVNQKNLPSLPFKSEIVFKNELSDEIERFSETWSFMSRTNGVWYSLGIEQDGLFSALPIIDTDFKEIRDPILPYWIDNEEVLSNYTRLDIVEKYKNEVFRLIEYLINLSPDNTIMLLTRYQGGDFETVQGVIPFGKFRDLLNEGKILFNSCYIVRD